jgi:hypothetical protein
MTDGTIGIKLRPIKLAFLVSPTDEAALLEAIEINTFLWGGMFNPIIPTFERIPRVWEERPSKNLKSKEILAGYLDAYDPDYVVPLGKYSGHTFDIGNRRIISSSEILTGVEEDGTPKYGIGLFDILQYFIDKELKFLRRQPLDICLSDFAKPYHLFMASILGSLSQNIDRIFKDNFERKLGAKRLSCSISNYCEFLTPSKLSLRRISSLYLNRIQARGWGRDQCIFFLDAANSLDIIDYWNLRAVGWTVIPVPKQASESDKTKQLALSFIEENFFPDRFNPQIYHNTTLLKSRSISKKEIENFARSLRISPPDKSGESKIVFQHWYPRIWDEWARDKGGAVCCEIESRTARHDLSDYQKRITFRTLDPKFIGRFGGHGEPRFANEVELSCYGSKEVFAEVIPESDEKLVKAIGGIGFREWRFTKKGMVYLSRHLGWSVNLSLPKAEDVFLEWLKLQEWKAELSGPGRIAEQMLKQVGGIWGISTLANEGIIRLLEKVNSSAKDYPDLLVKFRKLQKLLTKRDVEKAAKEVKTCISDIKKIEMRWGITEKSMQHKALWGEISKIANQEKFIKDPNRILQRLIDARIFRLGVEMQCPICRQRSWYSIKDADYELQCSKCLERFTIPSHSPKEIEWSYRTSGPFSLPNQAYGVYSVLLTLRFFAQLLDGATTPIMSFTAKKDGKKIEADLGLLFQESRFGYVKTELIFAECKTYNHFEKRDADRMNLLADEFPGAVLVFATLRKSLTEKEKRLLRPVANRGRRYWKAERPFNPVLLLTGVELFADWRPPQCWKDARGKQAAFAKNYRAWGDLLQLCDATQQLYLDMQPWRQWLEERWEKRRQKRALSSKRETNWHELT